MRLHTALDSHRINFVIKANELDKVGLKFLSSKS